MADREAESLLAWNQLTPAFAIRVSHHQLNFLGRAFGGNIVEWHMRGALAAARVVAASSAQLTSVRLRKGTVNFTTPLFAGDEVRAFVDLAPSKPLPLLQCQPVTSTYRVHLVARRPQGFSEAPLTILEVGTSEFEVTHTPIRQDRLSRYKTLRGFDIGGIVRNDVESCHHNPFYTAPADEGSVRRSSQLTAAADVRFYILARELLGGHREHDPIVTRSLSFEFLDRAFEQTPARAPLNFHLPHSGEIKAVHSNRFIKLGGEIRAGHENLAAVQATMVQLGRAS
jgi:hypothetical protein